MRKTVLTAVTASLLVGFLTYYWCSSRHSKMECDKPHKAKNEICMDYEGPISSMNYELIREMTRDYQGKKVRIFNQISEEDNSFKKVKDANSVWFDLEVLKEFIYKIEKITQENFPSVVIGEDLGIRIYYADYPELARMSRFPDLADVPKDYERHHTVIMIPTKKTIINDNEYNQDFHLLNPDLTNFKESKKFKPLVAAALSGFDDGTVISRNHGGLIPPKDGSNLQLFPDENPIRQRRIRSAP